MSLFRIKESQHLGMQKDATTVDERGAEYFVSLEKEQKEQEMSLRRRRIKPTLDKFKLLPFVGGNHQRASMDDRKERGRIKALCMSPNHI